MGAGSMNVCTLCVPAKEVTRYLVTHRRLGAGIFSYAGCLACNDVYTYSNRCSARDVSRAPLRTMTYKAP